MGAIIREQGSSFISYWTLLISEALIKHGADICHDWEAYEESFVKAQRSSAMSQPVHLSSLPLTGCLDVSLVSSFSATPSGRKWTSEASRNASAKHSPFLIKQPRYQPSQSDHDVLIRLTEADWYWLSEQRRIFLVAASLLPRFHFCIFIKEHFSFFFFFLVGMCFSSTFPHKTFNSVWRKCCQIDACYPIVNLSESNASAFQDTDFQYACPCDCYY